MPPLSDLRLVVNTNTLLRGLAKRDSVSGKIVYAIERRNVLLLTSKRVVDEYRIILLDPVLLDQFPPLTPKSVEVVLRRILYRSEYLGNLSTRFELPRDRRDEKFVKGVRD
jgi:predicted nucleic acid-binding protein